MPEINTVLATTELPLNCSLAMDHALLYSTSRLNLPDAHAHIWAHSKSPHVTLQGQCVPTPVPTTGLVQGLTSAIPLWPVPRAG